MKVREPSRFVPSVVRRVGGSALSAQAVMLASVVLVQIVQVPVFLYVAGVEEYGSYLLLIAVPSMFALADLGLLTATSTRMTVLVAQKRLEAAATVASMSLTILFSVVSALVVTLVTISVIADFGRTPFSNGQAQVVIIVYSAYASFLILGNYFEAVLRAAALHALGWSILSAVRVFEFALAVGCVVGVGSLWAAPVGLLVGRFIGLMILAASCRRRVLWHSLQLKLPRWNVMVGLLRPTAGSFAVPLGNAALNQGMLFVVGLGLGSTAVVSYSVSRTLVNFVRQVVNAFLNAVLPKLTAAMAAGDEQMGRSLDRDAVRGALAVSVLGGLVTLLVGPAIISYWAGGDVEPGRALLAWISAASIVECVVASLSLILIAQNRQLSYSAVYLFASITSLIVLQFVKPQDLEYYGLSLALVWIVVGIWVVRVRSVRSSPGLL